MRDTGSSKPLGRPKLPAEDARANRVVTFVTNQELEKIRTGAEAEGCSLSSYLHRLLKAGLDDSRKRSVNG